MKTTRLALDLGLALGLVCLAGGGFLLLEHVGVLGEAAGDWGPPLLAALGFGQVLFGDNRIAKATGSGLIAVGGVLLLLGSASVDWHDAGSYVWRIALLAVGVGLVIRFCFFEGDESEARSEPDPVFAAAGPGPALQDAPMPERLQLVSVLSSQERRLDTDFFAGGQMHSVMGACDLDLRQADFPEGGEVVLEVFSLMGEGRIRVPAGWTVVSELVPVLADVRVKARRQGSGPEKRVRIKGFAVMSDIEVRN